MHESIVPKIYREETLDEKLVVEDGEAFEVTRLLAQKEGLCRYVEWRSHGRRFARGRQHESWNIVVIFLTAAIGI